MACFPAIGRGKVESLGQTAEKVPGSSALGRHPWEITLREFIERVRRDYGIEIEPVTAAIAGGRFLSKDRRLYPVLILDEDEPMPIFLLRSYCSLYRIPPEDFGLSFEEDD